MKDYLSQFEVKVGKAHYRLDGAITLQLLQRGINQDLRDRMVDGNALPTTFTAWKARLITYELRLEAIKLDKQALSKTATPPPRRTTTTSASVGVDGGPPLPCYRCGGLRGTKPPAHCISPWWHRYREPTAAPRATTTTTAPPIVPTGDKKFDDARAANVCVTCGGKWDAPKNGCTRKYHEARTRATIEEVEDSDQEDNEVDRLRAQIQEYARKAKIMQERVDKKVGKVEKKEKTKQGFQDDQ